MGRTGTRPRRPGVVRLTGLVGTFGVGVVAVGATLAPVGAGGAPSATVGHVDPVGPVEPSVTVTELAPLAGTGSGAVAVPVDINNRGDVVGSSEVPGGFGQPPVSQRATRWRPGSGEARAVPTREGDVRSAALRINDRRQVAIAARGDTGSWRYSLRSGGRVADLPADLGTVFALNERGEVLMGTGEGFSTTPAVAGVWRDGRVRRITPPEGTNVVAVTPQSLSDRGHVAVDFSTGHVTWAVPPAPLRDLGANLWWRGARTELHPTGAATAVNDRGQVVGTTGIVLGGQATEGAIWDTGDDPGDGRGAAAPTLVPLFTPVDVNDRGQVVGLLATPGAGAHAAVWDGGELVDLGSLGGASAYSVPFAINERGQVLGISRGTDGGQHLAVWTSGRWLDLGLYAGNALAAHGPDINDRGQVVGVVRGPGGSRGILAEVHDPAT
jgi:probable HAF family extracellular repeat protein